MIIPSETKVLFMGTPQFAVPTLSALFSSGYCIVGVVTQPDRPQGRHMTMTPPPVKEFAVEKGLKVIQPDSCKTKEFAEEIKSLAPDVILTAAYGKILPKEILDIPRACVNIHASLLPKYRGASPIQNSIFNGDSETGITIMEMDIGMDTGDIIYSKSIPILPDMTAGELSVALSDLGAKLIVEILPKYLNGQIKPFPQDESKATVVKPIRREDARIDWSKTAKEVHNKVRGCMPTPGAFTFFNEKRMKVMKTAIIDELPNLHLECSQTKEYGNVVVSCDKNRLFVRCSDKYIEILSLQIAGLKCLPAGDCAHNFWPECRFGG